MGRPKEDFMTKRILLAGILGGGALFLWGGLSHTVLGLGETGVRPLPQPQPLVDAMKASIPQSGFYYFPQRDDSGKVRPEDANGPYGILIYRSRGAYPAMSRLLTKECILNIVQALLAAFLLSLATELTGYLSRVGFVVLAGLLGGAAFALEIWNWYGFPRNYTLGMLADRLIGFLIVGLIVAALVKPSPARMQLVGEKA
jgi:hypothetical protein